jgi:hypothetical protein
MGNSKSKNKASPFSGCYQSVPANEIPIVNNYDGNSNRIGGQKSVELVTQSQAIVPARPQPPVAKAVATQNNYNTHSTHINTKLLDDMIPDINGFASELIAMKPIPFTQVIRFDGSNSNPLSSEFEFDKEYTNTIITKGLYDVLLNRCDIAMGNALGKRSDVWHKVSIDKNEKYLTIYVTVSKSEQAPVPIYSAPRKQMSTQTIREISNDEIIYPEQIEYTQSSRTNDNSSNEYRKRKGKEKMRDDDSSSTSDTSHIRGPA